MELAVIPTTLAELAPPRYRGGIVGMYWLSIKIGGLVISSITRTTSKIPSNLSWQIPFSLFFIIPTIVLSLIWFIPESPRWLLFKSRREKALASLHRLRRGRSTEEEIIAEINQLEQLITEQPRNNRLRDIFMGSNRRRTFIVLMANFFQQSTGQSFASQYGTLFVQSIGTLNPFSVNMGNNAVTVGAIFICLVINDKIGRNAVIQIASLLTMGSLGTIADKSVVVKQAIVSMVLVYSFGYSVGWAPLTYVLSTELPSPALREDTLRVAYTVKIFMEFLISFTYPYLEDPSYANLGSKLGFIYGSMAVGALLFGHFCIPETRDLALEDIDVQFRDEIPVQNIRNSPIVEDLENAKEKKPVSRI
ncbi:hypothetical protein BZG36_04686 [Bifiguratus adelaidae]|uniref:Major facilitator superfamily (MFS) profile domain-containing protein n=1 Tax=Bifiguratus adelaidae TaxID=1938954 RepID=A0A261XUG1_9FUNG|nr:hypothetical protein BZG36_04686 [Bifiguratus adelaidae]